MKSMENDALALSRCLSLVVNANPPLSVPVESKFKYTPPSVYFMSQQSQLFRMETVSVVFVTIKKWKLSNPNHPITPFLQRNVNRKVAEFLSAITSPEYQHYLKQVLQPKLAKWNAAGKPTYTQEKILLETYSVKLPMKTIAGADWLCLEIESVLPKINLVSTIATKFGTNVGLRMFHKSKKGVPMLPINELFFVSIIKTFATDRGKSNHGSASSNEAMVGWLQS
ncbi:hypothetical protein BCR33DRAFT_732735 [Rhizoclosmatium globosum]|uniref:Uncharacterized protein n=1 Tax=Rhizoclosmatium globosum TaxID=329046 RepID=A0A1Y2D186_9FUNG|nr:hypothetical protein BCR33DRAFT_732735 [Rhizoclosmatium globosum]|eukprot:ORY52894.1 hypothetical protein BCR33DRAFT_732735 [Rhizoclosmatium globosum]